MEEQATLERHASEQVLQLVCFKLAEEEYAVEMVKVQEVVRIQRITRVPQMPEFVLGVINIRGFIIPVFDLRKRFSLDTKPFDEKTKMLIADVDGSLIAFIVDEIRDDVKIRESSVDPSPKVRMKIKRECIRGVGQMEDRMIIILDLDRLSSDMKEELELIGKKLVK